MNDKITICPAGYAWGYKPAEQWFLPTIENELDLIEFHDPKDLPRRGKK